MAMGGDADSKKEQQEQQQEQQSPPEISQVDITAILGASEILEKKTRTRETAATTQLLLLRVRHATRTQFLLAILVPLVAGSLGLVTSLLISATVIQAPSGTPGVNLIAQRPPDPKDFKELKSELKTVKEELAAIRKLILDNPEKAITVALIQKDLSLLKEQQSSLARQVVQTASLSKWFLLAMFSLSIGMLGLAGSLGYRIFKS